MEQKVVKQEERSSYPEWTQNSTYTEYLLRWRLILGKFSNDELLEKMDLKDLTLLGKNIGMERFDDLEKSLSFLYDREYKFEEEYNIVEQWDAMRFSSSKYGSSTGHAALTVPKWLSNIKELFPEAATKTLEDDAIKKYGLHEILTDEDLLDKIEPDLDLVKVLLTFKRQMKPSLLEKAKRIIKTVVDQLEKKILNEVNSAITGVKNRFQSSPLRVAKNFDINKTVRRNLKNYDPHKKRLMIDSVYFCSRIFKQKDWHVIICIDQSGSMTDSIIHSAIMGGIFASIKSLKTNLILFDTQVVDLSEHMSNIVEVLFSVQLGGGTNIARAMKYCQSLITNPLKTVFVLITDFYEGGSPQKMINIANQLKETGVTQIGLAALDYKCTPSYDKEVATRLSEEAGMEIGVKTPKELAEFVFKVINCGR
ncbi:MAG: VWA containing CoxE family protein [Promethearchaeota archaeon]|nr:MAG: VWA containing CoxE family protein [Candidatus Lokiarchaeota archaeon]